MEELAAEMIIDEKYAHDSQNALERTNQFGAGINGFGFDHECFVYQNRRYHILFNGTIYNRDDLQEKLMEQGFTFETESDHEIILALYISEKERCVQSFRGMFAFAIWNEHDKTLFAARDPFGIKPFYYTETEEGLFFGSDMTSLMHLVDDKYVPQETLQHYLTYQYVPDSHSLVKGIHKLEPGHCLIKEPGEVPDVQMYYRKTFNVTDKPFNEYVGKTRDALEESVAEHMKAEGTVGAFLSSGIDSTAIVALAKRYQKNLKTFSVGFENQGYNETDIARETADQLGVQNFHRLITPEDFVNELPNVIRHLDSPVADPAAIPLYFAAKEAGKHAAVVLSGEGADELFGGYNIYREPLALRGFDFIPGFLKNILKQIAMILPEGVKGKSYVLRGTTPLSERYAGNANIFSENEKKTLLTNYQTDAPFTRITHPLFQDAMAYDASLKMQYIDIHTWLPGDILVKAENMTKAHSIELRAPFLDKEVFDIAREIPTKHKISNKTTKYVLRKAVKDIVPENVLYRKKLGFPVPIRHWLRHELYDWARDIIVNSPTGHLIKKDVILSLLEEHALGKKDNSRKIWVILVFMQWYSQQEMGSRIRAFE